MSTTSEPEMVRARIELPFTARAPKLANPALGIDRVVVLSGAGRRQAIDVTVLDTPDQRLLRAGVRLAHRISEGRGEWYLAAPGWAPWLPEERLEPMGDGDLPEALANLVRPFRRAAPLGPVASLRRECWTYALHDGSDVIATLDDHLTTVRTGGVITSRYRQATLTGGALTEQQRAWVLEMLTLAGGTVVEEFPPLTSRLGSPATGRTDFPPPPSWDAESSLETAISAILAARLQMIIVADLALRGAGPGADPADLAEQLRALATELRGLAPLLVDAARASAECRALADRLAEAEQLINGLRYLAILDGLVRAVRSPRLVGGVDAVGARDGLRELLDRVRDEFVAAMDGLSPDAADPDWRDAWTAADQLIHTSTVTELVSAKSAAKLRRRTEKLMAALTECLADTAAIAEQPEALTASEAFEAGRAFERAYVVRLHARNDLLQTWAKARKRFE